MNNEFIPETETRDLKKLGFNETCLAIFNGNNIFYGDFHSNHAYYNEHAIILYQQAFRWLREKFDLCIHIRENEEAFIKSGGKKYVFFINGFHGSNIYEEAELDCLKKLIEIAKAKKVESSN